MKQKLLNLFFTIMVFVIFLKVIFYSEALLTILKLVAAISWLLIIPSFFIFKEHSLENMTVGMLFSAVIVGLGSYYLGLVGISFSISAVILPLAVILAGKLYNKGSVKQENAD